MKKNEVTENYIFRFFECGLTVKKTCDICDVSQTTVKRWDSGKAIPKYYRTIMKQCSGMQLDSIDPCWRGWQIRGKWMITPLGEHITMEQILFISLRAPQNHKA